MKWYFRAEGAVLEAVDAESLFTKIVLRMNRGPLKIADLGDLWRRKRIFRFHLAELQSKD